MIKLSTVLKILFIYVTLKVLAILIFFGYLVLFHKSETSDLKPLVTSDQILSMRLDCIPGDKRFLACTLEPLELPACEMKVQPRKKETGKIQTAF